MTYVDSSVCLSYLFGEPRQPPVEFWGQDLVGSRLVAHEVVTRLWAEGIDPNENFSTRRLLGRISFLPMTNEVLQRMSSPWPVRLRTLDAMHLATAVYLRERGQEVQIATFDIRFIEAARALSFALAL